MLRGGSERALSYFIDRYTPYVGSVAAGIVGAHMSQADVEEVVAGVFVALWNNADKVQPDRVKGWLGSVARNAAKNKLREPGQELPLEEDALVIDAKTPETETELRERDATVRAVVRDMGWPDSEIFLRHYFYFQTVEAIAQALDMNPSTVKTRLRRGREKLARALTSAGL